MFVESKMQMLCTGLAEFFQNARDNVKGGEGPSMYLPENQVSICKRENKDIVIHSN